MNEMLFDMTSKGMDPKYPTHIIFIRLTYKEKITKGQSEATNRKRTDNTKPKEKDKQ